MVAKTSTASLYQCTNYAVFWLPQLLFGSGLQVSHQCYGLYDGSPEVAGRHCDVTCNFGPKRIHLKKLRYWCLFNWSRALGYRTVPKSNSQRTVVMMQESASTLLAEDSESCGALLLGFRVLIFLKLPRVFRQHPQTTCWW